MNEFELIGFKLNNLNFIKETEFILLDKLNTFIGNNESIKSELLDRLLTINSFKTEKIDKILFLNEDKFQNVDIIIEFKIDEEFRDIISKLLNNSSIIKDKIRIGITKEGIFNIDIFHHNADVGSRSEIVQLLKNNIPRVEYFCDIDDNIIEEIIQSNRSRSTVLVFDGLEKHCMEKKHSLEGYCKEKIGEYRIIHFTTTPYIVNSTEVENNIIDIDRKFAKVNIKEQSYDFYNIEKLMVLATGVSIFVLLLRFLYIFARVSHSGDNIGFLDKVSKSLFTFTKEAIIMILIIIVLSLLKLKFNDFIMRISILILLVILLVTIFFNFEICKFIVVGIFLCLFTVLYTFEKSNGEKYMLLFIAPVIGAIKILYPIIMAIVIAINLAFTLLISIFFTFCSYRLVGKALLELVDFELEYLEKPFSNISNIAEYAISNLSFSKYMLVIVFVVVAPYMVGIAKIITKIIFSYVNKPLIVSSQKVVDTFCNVKVLRIILYFTAFLCYFTTFIVKFKSNNFELIKEGFLTWIILDVVLFGIFEYIDERISKEKKKEKVKFHKKILMYFDGSIMDKNKFQLYDIFLKIEKDKVDKFYFKFGSFKFKKENYISEYYSDLFNLYDWIKKQRVLSQEVYISRLEKIKEIIDSKEIELIVS